MSTLVENMIYVFITPLIILIAVCIAYATTVIINSLVKWMGSLNILLRWALFIPVAGIVVGLLNIPFEFMKSQTQGLYPSITYDVVLFVLLILQVYLLPFLYITAPAMVAPKFKRIIAVIFGLFGLYGISVMLARVLSGEFPLFIHNEAQEGQYIPTFIGYILVTTGLISIFHGLIKVFKMKTLSEEPS